MKIKFFKIKPFINTDERRKIEDITLPESVSIPFKIRQIKLITISDKAVKEKMVLGNHYHTSNRWEFFMVIGELDVFLFKLKFRNSPEDEIQEKELKANDAILVPPGCTHSFLPFRSGVKLLGISNLAYDSDHDVNDKIF